MPDDLLSLRLQPMTGVAPDERVRPAGRSDIPALARAYLESYPPDVGAGSYDEALAEIGATFDGEFGELLPRASLVVHAEGSVVGAIFTTARSIWDDLDGPFIIDLFVAPEFRGRGFARALIGTAAAACAVSGAERLSLRVGEGTSPSAWRLYDDFGFARIDEPRADGTTRA